MVQPVAQTPRFRRPLIKLSGEALAGGAGYGIDAGETARIAGEVAEAIAQGCRPALVVGGGNIFRGLSGVAAGMDRVKSDHMGMLATIMNAMALEQAFAACGVPARIYSGVPVPSICRTFNAADAGDDLNAGRLVIFAGGTGNPFFTTDTAAALRAAEMGCDAILKATNIDGIYAADPRENPQAERYEKLSYTEVLARDLRVMDGTAIALARDNAIPIAVFSLARKGAIADVLMGRGVFTIVQDTDPAA